MIGLYWIFFAILTCFWGSLSNDLQWFWFDWNFVLAFSFSVTSVTPLVVLVAPLPCGLFCCLYLVISNPTPPSAEMGDSLLSEPPLTAEPAPSSAAATPTPAAAEPGGSLAPPTSTAAATSPGAANTDLLGGQWASRKFSTKGFTLGSSALKFTSQHENTDD